MIKPRSIYLLLAIFTMFLGLASRSNMVELPEFISVYAGDTLWALMVFWLLCALQPASPATQPAIMAVCFSFCIEFSQFYHAPWIDNIRSTTIGGLVLGYGFKFSDLVCYAIGVGIGFTLNSALVSSLNKK